MYLKFLKRTVIDDVLSLRWGIGFICLTLLSGYASIQIQTHSQNIIEDFNVLDVFFYQFGLYMFVFLSLSTVYISLISKIAVNPRVDNYIYLRFKKISDVWYFKIALLSILTFLFLFLAVGINLFIGGMAFEKSLQWSEGLRIITSSHKESILNLNYIGANFLSENPLFTMCILLVELYFYLLFVGIIVISTSFYFKRAFYGFFVGVIINFLTLIITKIDYVFNDFPYLLHNKIFLQNQIPSFTPLATNSVGNSVVFWILLIFISIILSFWMFKKKDYLFEVKDHD